MATGERQAASRRMGRIGRIWKRVIFEIRRAELTGSPLAAAKRFPLRTSLMGPELAASLRRQ